MKTSYLKEYSSYNPKNLKSNKIFQNNEQFKSSNNPSYQTKKNSVPFTPNIIKFNSNINMMPKTYFNMQKNLNPTHMKFNNGTKKVINQYYSQSQEKENNILKKSAIFQQRLNKKNDTNIIAPKKKMGISQLNFYNKKNINMNLFPNIQYNNKEKEKENLFSINQNWMLYNQNSQKQQGMYNDFIKNMIIDNNNPEKGVYKDYYISIFDFGYKRKEEKLKKGQNQLILEKLQKKYESQIKAQNLYRTGTGFYQKNQKTTKINNRQRSAQDKINSIKSVKNQEKPRNKKDTFNSEFSKKNSISSINSNYDNSSRVQIDASNQSLNNDKNFNKTYNVGFNFKKKKKEQRKKEKIIFIKIFKHFTKRTKNNYLWIKYFNKKIKLKLKEEESDFYFNTKPKHNKSLDINNTYPKLIKKILHKNIIYKKTKKILIKKEDIKYNSDNSEIDLIKEYKKQQKRLKDKKLQNNTHYIRINDTNKNKKEKIILEPSSESDSDSNIFSKKNEPQFCGIFDKDFKNDTNPNDTIPKEEKEKVKRNFNFRTTANFFSKSSNNNNNKEDSSNNYSNNQKNFESNKAQNTKFNIENIINNVIENNKKAAAARSSTSFYNIGSNFMNNRMRSTKTNFFSAKENKGGNFTGTKDSNFTKAQANEGRYYKPNSLKLSLINPLAWRKHEEIWGNLLSLKLGLNDLEKYLHPPNDTDVLISSYLKMNPRIINFCPLQKINTSKTNNENNNFISFMIDDNIQNPKQEIKKWKEAYKRVIFRWHPDKLFANLEEINFKNEQQKIELKKKSTQIINNMNSLYKNIIETLNKIADAKNDKMDEIS